MRISWEDIDKYGNHYKLVENYAVYGITFDCADDMEKARKQFRNLYSRMVYSVRKDEKYKDVAFIVGLSCHDGKNCKQHRVLHFDSNHWCRSRPRF